MTKRLFTSILVAGLVTVGLAAPASADEARSSDRRGGSPTLLSSERIDWIAGSSEWVHLSWTTSDELENVEVRVTRQSSGLSVEYPNGGEFSSLMVDNTLSPKEIDFTALKVTTDASSRGTQRALVEISWDEDGKRERAVGWLRFTNKAYKGDDFAILTEQATISLDPAASEANWVEFGYKGLAPTTTDMQFTVSGPMPVYHPQEEFTSLHHDQTLHAGESDVARVWFDPATASAGTHALTVTISYTNSNGERQRTSHEVKLEAVA